MTSRKIQAEIDRVIKKIHEGIADFDDTLEKMNASSNPNMINKYEASLKTEIKKLQRCRDQMKAWIASPEVKDKSLVIENRKRIESYMERFKAIEKEMKTKAYSKEGLMQTEKIDPKQKEKIETSDWLTNFVSELSHQINQLEAELEGINLLPKKKKDHNKIERVNTIKHMVDRHRHHIKRLELIKRLLENDHVSAEKINEIKDSVAYYIEENKEPDFEEDEYMYDELNLDQDVELFAVITEEHHLAQTTMENSVEETSKVEDKPQPLPSFKDNSIVTSVTAAKATQASKPKNTEPSPLLGAKETPSTDVIRTSDSAPPLKKTQSLSPKTPQKKVTLITAPKKATKDTTISKGTDENSEPPRSLAEVVSSVGTRLSEPSSQKTKANSSTVAPSAPKVLSSITTPSTIATSTVPMKILTPSTPLSPPTLESNVALLTSTLAPPSGPSPLSILTNTSSIPQMQEKKTPTALSSKTSPLAGAKHHSTPRLSEPSAPKPLSALQNIQPNIPASERMKNSTSITSKPAQHENPPSKVTLPTNLKDLGNTLDEAKGRLKIYLEMMAKARNQNPPTQITANNALIARAYYERMLETAFHHKIELNDLDPPRLYTPIQAHSTPTSFPCQPLASLLDPELFSFLDQDTLFFIFYYQKSTYQQYLAARELHKQWRFHTQFNRWFRLTSKTSDPNQQYEVGTVTFFDYNEPWACKSEGCLKIMLDQVKDKLPN